MIYLAPLQGFTDFVYRKAYASTFSGIDEFFIPYITVQQGEVSKKFARELLSDNNPPATIPQILPKDADEAVFLIGHLRKYGYSEVNLNLGCPYPMATKRGRGAGLLPHPEKVKAILEASCNDPALIVSVKMRAGLEALEEIEKIIPVLNRFPLKEVILHPRLARQLYKGELYTEAFATAEKELIHPLVFNGDICNVADFKRRAAEFPGVQRWMIGRGVLMNAFLPDEIKGSRFSEEEKRAQLYDFHREVLEGNLQRADNPGNALTKMQQFWTYFAHHFQDPRKTFKRIKKVRSFEQMKAESERILNRERIVETC